MDHFEQNADSELAQLTNELLDGRIDVVGRARLEELLRGNVAAQKKYLAHCQLHVDLRVQTQAERVIRTFTSVDFCKEGSDPNSCRVIESPARKSEGRGRSVVKRKAPPLVGLAATVAFVAATAALWHMYDEPGGSAGANEIGAVSEDIVAVRIASTESRWLPIQEVGKIFIQGPADFQLIGSKRARLTHGRIRVCVTDPRGRGFVVETPRGAVTDLGTEFGVDVERSADTHVVVFQGKVDLSCTSSVPEVSGRVEHLVQGEGLTIGESGEMRRIMSIVRGGLATFRTRSEFGDDADQIIVDVSDNIRTPDTKKFYEIVPRGLKEDALAYVDREAHDWNGVDEDGIPSYLIGADYIKPFNGDKARSDTQISVTLAKPARLFVFFDNRVVPPHWLLKNFRNTGDTIGHDAGPYLLSSGEYEKFVRGRGPGISIDSEFSVWELVVSKPGTIQLGPNASGRDWSAMYGIAAVPLEVQPAERP